MESGKLVFAQLMDFVPRHDFDACPRQFQGLFFCFSARFKSRSHLPDGIGFSKLPVFSMLGLFVPHKHRFTEETDMDCQATLSISVTQCDPTSATTPLHWPAPATVHVSCPAKQLAPQQRRDLAIQVLAGTDSLRVGPRARGQQEVPLSTGSHRRGGAQRSLRMLKLDFNSTNTSPCRDMTYVVFPDRRKSLATKNLRRLVPRIGRNSLLGNRLR